jgi:hypothetical protein
MTRPITKRLAPAILAIGIAGGSLCLTAGHAFASSTKGSGSHKIGSTCTKSEVNETVKVNKTTLTCKEVIRYEWQK